MKIKYKDFEFIMTTEQLMIAMVGTFLTVLAIASIFN